jgi:hypothetical protein
LVIPVLNPEPVVLGRNQRSLGNRFFLHSVG